MRVITPRVIPFNIICILFVKEVVRGSIHIYERSKDWVARERIPLFSNVRGEKLTKILNFPNFGGGRIK